MFCKTIMVIVRNNKVGIFKRVSYSNSILKISSVPERTAHLKYYLENYVYVTLSKYTNSYSQRLSC